MAERAPAPDQAQRDRIVGSLSETLFVEAGAGSGKTTALVDRVLALVTTPADPAVGRDPVPLASVAAITFTEKAGAELRQRLREGLEKAVEDPSATGTPRAEACQVALDELDGAAIGTLHSFAQRILSDHPVEAGLPPRVEVLDEVASGIEFTRRWNRFSDDLFADDRYQRTLLLLFAAGVRETTINVLARTFEDNWDLVETHVPPDAPEPQLVEADLRAVLEGIAAVADQIADCSDETDKLSVHLCKVRDHVDVVGTAPDEIALLEQLRAWRDGSSGPGFSCAGGAKKGWGSSASTVKADLRAAGESIDEALAEVARACAAHLGSAIRRFTLASADERRRAGTLEYHDLLVMARGLLRDPDHGSTVRRALHQRYQRLLLDEFQDTDPIQLDLAVRIAAADPGSDEAGTSEWDAVEVGEGRLFVVGDPKQSIYRFRRADIALFLEAGRRFAPEGGAVGLSANFRTGRSIIGWVNETFDCLMSTSSELVVDSQPPYRALDAVRDDPPDESPPVCVLGREPHPAGTTATEVRAAEATEVVATVRRAMAEGWLVGDGEGGWRPALLGDITILVPARTSLPHLEDALTDAGIAYRAEASSLVYATRAVRDLLMVVRAVADPTDHLRIVSALRTPLFGCGDDDLYRYKVERGGRWSYLAPRPDAVPDDDPVAAGLSVLAAWHEQRAWTSPSALLDAIARDRRAFELGFAEGRPRDVWRRIRFVIDQARAWTDATGGDLRQYLDWVGQQTVEGARVAEAVLPETDDDAVRIMTIHAAKGLEFPITIVSGLSSGPTHGPRPGEARFTDGTVSYYLGKHAQTPEFNATRPLDEQMGFDERIRLLYVATTRAQDHLVVSLHRKARKSSPTAANRTNAELLVDGMDDLLGDLPDGPAELDGPIAALTSPPVAAPEPFPTWQVDRDAALAVASQPTTVAATALTDEGRPEIAPLAVTIAPDGEEDISLLPEPEPSGQLPLDFAAPVSDTDLDASPDGTDAGLRKRPIDLDRAPWLKGRYGTAVGRAVHGALQTVALGSSVDDPATAGAIVAQCQAEAVPDQETTVRQLVAEALASPSVRAAAAAPHWREIYACTPIGGPDGRLLEGYVDLLYRAPDGLVVVDYKTSGTAASADLDRRVEGYRRQGASYALSVARATGEPVVRVVFCFLTPAGVVERTLPDLPAAVADVEAAVIEGSAVEVG